MTSRSAWQVSKHNASVQSSKWSCEFDIARPPDGLHNITYGGRRIDDFSPLRLDREDARWSPRECYVRGEDLVVNYLPIDSNTRQLQLRAHANDDQLSIELLVATHTSLLDSDPTLETSTLADAADFFYLPDHNGPLQPLSSDSAKSGSFLIRFHDLDVSYAEMVFPSDFRASQLSVGPQTISYKLFHDRMEKGVIRRARVKSLFLPREADEALMRADYAEFSGAAPPLTA